MQNNIQTKKQKLLNKKTESRRFQTKISENLPMCLIGILKEINELVIVNQPSLAESADKNQTAHA